MTGTEEAPDAADTPWSLGAREARARRLPLGSRHIPGSGRVPDRHLRGGLWARSQDWQGVQGAPYQWTVAALRTLREVDTGPLPPPLHSARFLWGRWSGRLAPQVATLAQGACLPPVGQEAHRPQALEAVGHEMEQQTPDTLLGLQRHGLPLIALAPMAIRAAYAAIAHLQEAMIGHRDAVERASQVLEHLGWSGARSLGVDSPRLAIELVEQMGEACGGPVPSRRWSKAQRLCVVGLG
jgi:hypothetical protein